MSVIIRLQNLPWSANALDIRQFFHGLSIPEGGVHIVGGELGDAFIAFSTDEDARQAFNRNSGKIKEIQIKLLLSSRTEMQKVIEAARTQTIAAFMNTVPPQPVMPSIVPAAVPEIRKEEKADKRDKKRSRSRSRDRKDRSYERKRDRRRDRSRSKSRDRDRSSRDRRRRDRSRSRDKSRSRDRDRKGRDGRRNSDKGNNPFQNTVKEPRNVWESPLQNLLNNPPVANSANLLASFMANNILPSAVPQALKASSEKSTAQRENFQSRWEHNNSFANKSQSGDKNNFDNFDDRPNYNARNSGGGMDNQQQNQNRNQNRDREESYPNCCIKLEPFFGPFGEIRRFFNGLFIHNNGIKFINDEFGKRTGVVYIKFAYPEGKDEAMGRSGDKVRNQMVAVSHITDEEFERAVDRYIPEDFNDHEERLKHFGKTVCTCLIMENAPSYVKEVDVREMFTNHTVATVLFEPVHRNNNVYIKFNTSLEATKAFKDKDAHVFEGKQMKVDFCHDDVFEKIEAEFGDDKLAVAKPPEPTNTILMSGLPLKVNSERDILDFFSDIGVMPSKIHLMSGEMGFSGEAVCEFYTTDAAILGFQKNGMPFGNGTVSMKYQPKRAVSSPVANLNLNANFGKTPLPNLNQRMPFPQQFPNNVNMNPPFMNNINRPPFFPRNNFMGGPRGPPRFPMQGNLMGPRGPRRFNPPPHHQTPPPSQDDCDDDLAPAGCILLMENVPYKAGLDEIMEFLDGFDVPTENILRKYNPNGLPSGETKVIFNSPNEVYQAIEEKKGCRIRERLIYLSQI